MVRLRLPFLLALKVQNILCLVQYEYSCSLYTRWAQGRVAVCRQNCFRNVSGPVHLFV